MRKNPQHTGHKDGSVRGFFTREISTLVKGISIIGLSICTVATVLVLNVFAADGSGTATVSPTTAESGSTGGTYTFTYTAAETMTAGRVNVTMPAGWTAPQGTAGTEGYTTVSSTGTVFDVFDGANNIGGWANSTSAPKACSGGLSLETTDVQEGTGSIKCINSGDNNNGVWYKNVAAQDWSGATKIGFWIKSGTAITAGHLKFAYDNTANLASPIEEISVGALAANTWTFVPLTFGATTRTAVVSYGLKIGNVTARNATITLDHLLLGGTSTTPIFNGQIVRVFASLTAGQTITFTYGAGGGTSGVTAPSTTGVETFTMKSKISNTGAITAIASSPTVTLSAPPTVNSVSSLQADGTYGIGGTVPVQVIFSESVNVTGTPQLTLETGTTDVVLDYSSGSGSDTLVFTYTVQAGENASDLDYTNTSALSLNGGTIVSASSGYNAVLTLASPGAAGSLGANKDLVIDTTAPSAPAAPDLVAATDTGTSDTDNITNTTTPDFTGACTDGETITLYDGMTAVGSTVCASSAYTITASALTEGAHTMTVTAKDVANNESTASAGLNITLDITAPAAPSSAPNLIDATDSGTSNSDDLTKDTTPDFTGSCTDGETVTLYDGASAVGTLVCSSSAYTITASTLSEGGHTLTTTFTDPAGNEGGASSSLSVTIDVTAPDAPTTAPDMTAGTDTGSSDTDDITNDITPDFTGACTDGDTVSLYEGASMIGSATCAGSIYTITISPRSDGGHTITATFTDPAGNEGSASTGLGISIDTGTPSAPGSAPDMTTGTDTGSSQSDNVTNNNTPDFTGSCTDDDTVSIYDGASVIASVVCSGGVYTITVPYLSEGAHIIAATFTNIAGTESAASSSLNITIDNTAPGAPSSAPNLSDASDSGTSTTDDTTNVTTPVFTGSCTNDDTVTVYSNGSPVGSALCVGSVYSIITSTLTPGTQSITTTFTDPAGNVGAPSATLSVTVDTSAPSAPFTAPDMTAATDTGFATDDDITKDTTPDFMGSCTDGETVKLYNGASLLGSYTCVGGVYGITSSVLTDGDYMLTVTFSDIAGNESTASPAVNVKIETVPPVTLAAPNLTDATDTGVSNSDNLTKDATPDFTGTCVDGEKVTLYDDERTLGTATCSAGVYTITSLTLTDGVHLLTVKAMDTAGNVGMISAALSVVIDTTAPVVPAPDMTAATDTGASNTDNTTTDTTPDFTGVCAMGSTVKLYNDITVLGTHVCASETYTITSTPIGIGTYELTAKITDTAGNESTSSPSLSVTIVAETVVIPSSPTETTPTNTAGGGSYGGRTIAERTGSPAVTLFSEKEESTPAVCFAPEASENSFTREGDLNFCQFTGTIPLPGTQTNTDWNLAVEYKKDTQVTDENDEAVTTAIAAPQMVPQDELGECAESALPQDAVALSDLYVSFAKGQSFSTPVTLSGQFTDQKGGELRSGASQVLMFFNPKTCTWSPLEGSVENGEFTTTLTEGGVIGLFALSCNAPFTDINGHWAEQITDRLYCMNVIEGVMNNHTDFKPDQAITRAELVKIVVRLFGLKSSGSFTSFSDVEASAWYASYIATAKQAGLVEGYTDGLFHPEALVTRAEAAKIITRAAHVSAEDLTEAQKDTTFLTQFTDVTVQDWYAQYVAYLLKQGVLAPSSEKKFHPESNASRAELSKMALMLYNEMQK